MNLGNIFDNHNHSQFSFDGKKTSVEKSAKAAETKGLKGLCFTDHCDFFVPPMKAAYEHLVPEEFDVTAQQAEIDRAAEAVPRVKILKGIEIGLHEKVRDRIRDLVSSADFDQIIASVHYIDDTDPFYGGYYESRDWKEAYGHYAETLYREMTWLGNFDIMGHYDYIVRYAPYKQTVLRYKDFGDIFDMMFKYLVQEGKALEINTKTYKDYNGRVIEIDPDILHRYRETGGEIISLGSDSHNPERVGDNFEYFAALLKSYGFKYIAHYEKRKLVQTTL